jgi:hypothetical protein
MVQGQGRLAASPGLCPRLGCCVGLGREALALHFDDSALGFYPGSDVLGSLQVGDVGQRIGDADVRSLTTLRVGGRRDSSQVQALAFTRDAKRVGS